MPLRNWIELFNEVLIQSATFFLFGFTDWNANPASQELCGLIFLGHIALMVVVNVFFIIKQVKHTVTLVIIQKKNQKIERDKLKCLQHINQLNQAIQTEGVVARPASTQVQKEKLFEIKIPNTLEPIDETEEFENRSSSNNSSDIKKEEQIKAEIEGQIQDAIINNELNIFNQNNTQPLQDHEPKISKLRQDIENSPCFNLD